MSLKHDDFVLWLAERKVDNFLFMIGFVTIICGYSFWQPIEQIINVKQSGQVYFVSIPLCLFFWSFGWYILKYDKGKWLPMIAYLVCIERVIQEIFYPDLAQTYDWMEYVYFLFVCFYVFMKYLKYQKKRFIAFRKF